jgi:hypothetical protein
MKLSIKDLKLIHRLLKSNIKQQEKLDDSKIQMCELQVRIEEELQHEN